MKGFASIFWSFIFLWACLLFSVHGLRDEKTQSPIKRDFCLIAHRGFALNGKQINPENNPKSLFAALKEAHGVEFDVKLSSDGHLVLHHDDVLGYPFVGSGAIEELDLAKIMALSFDREGSLAFLGKGLGLADLTYRPENIPAHPAALTELLPWPSGKRAFLELKLAEGASLGQVYKYAEAAEAFIAKNNLYEDFTVISFHPLAPTVAKAIAASKGKYLLTGLDVREAQSNFGYLLGARLLAFDYFLPPLQSLDQSLLAQANVLGVGTIAWSALPLAQERALVTKINTSNLRGQGLILNATAGFGEGN